jgi:hypothetical protein
MPSDALVRSRVVAACSADHFCNAESVEDAARPEPKLVVRIEQQDALALPIELLRGYRHTTPSDGRGGRRFLYATPDLRQTVDSVESRRFVAFR